MFEKISDIPAVMAKLVIRHNFGSTILENVSVVETYQYDGSKYGGPKFDGIIVEGVCVGGGERARLFHVYSDTKYPTGVLRREDLWGRWKSIRPRGDCINGQWVDLPNEYEVSLESCG